MEFYKYFYTKQMVSRLVNTFPTSSSNLQYGQNITHVHYDTHQ